jgi:O-glycosyl hydrolase
MRLGGDVPGYQPSPGTWDWSADAGQRWMLQAARERGATLCEAFSNSPPYWMTRSGCAAGSQGGDNNLRDERIEDFVAYLCEVVAHFRDQWGITFRTVEPFNEPTLTHWRTGNRQEGCHTSRDQQNVVVARLAAQLAARGLADIAISASDEYSSDMAIDTFNALDAASRGSIAQINVHSYSGTHRADLRALAEANGKRLWMSEYGTGAGPHDHNAMAPALTLASQIRIDLTELRPSAWVYWQAVEHEGGNNWGFIHADFGSATGAHWMTKQYYAMAQYCTFIRPGYRIVQVGDMQTLAAYDPDGRKLVLVHDNAGPETQISVDLSLFGPVTAPVAAYRTSPTENLAALPPINLSDGRFSASVAAESISTFVIG